MNKYTIYWLDGSRQVVEGEDVADAFNRAGIQPGALRVVDFYAEGDDHEYTWDAVKRTWVSTGPIFDPS